MDRNAAAYPARISHRMPRLKVIVITLARQRGELTEPGQQLESEQGNGAPGGAVTASVRGVRRATVSVLVTV